jgi:cytoskeletal protein CcmA (bactofilin family)
MIEMEHIHTKKADVKIAGSGQTGGGDYNNVKISGSGKIVGDVSCNELSISGSGKVEGHTVAEKVSVSGSARALGNIETGYFKASGSMKIDGDLIANEAKASGSLKVEKDVKAKVLDVSGSMVILGDLYGETVKCSGDLKIDGNAEVEKLDVHGAIRMEGTLNVGEFNMRLHGNSRAKEIGGEKITIKQSLATSNFVMKMVKSLFLSSDKFTTDMIEGDEIYLEETKAQVVRGNKIVIGKGCEIGTVEYRDSLEVVGNGKVEKETKL